MSEDNYWTQPGTILTIASIIAVFAMALYCAHRYAAKSRTMRQEFAEKNDWGFSGKDTEGLSSKVEAFFPGHRFQPSNIVLVESGDRTIRLFEYSHLYRKSNDFGDACIIQSPRFRTNGAGKDIVEIVERTKIDTALYPDQVDMGDTEFSRKFITGSKNRIAAKNVVTPALQAVLLRHREVRPYDNLTIEISATGAVVQHFGTMTTLDPEMWSGLIELCREIEKSMP